MLEPALSGTDTSAEAIRPTLAAAEDWSGVGRGLIRQGARIPAAHSRTLRPSHRAPASGRDAEG
ncbi:hypothetical protein [Roseicella aerolata]|uniref:Uncharacterized protein n=1 Tax=Roseicella aerolata TaxID=2883479 RepID=A0A9X1L9C3_9PROT|nr:hypothetical protein [Roseicella aerolata]MCB4823524.1 hypothetical protein [Roseicella aerolata]